VNKKWRRFTDDYEKVFYEVKLPGGTIVKNCWPNAGGIWVAGKRYLPEDEIYVREQGEFIEEKLS
jgi:hypothetical protein